MNNSNLSNTKMSNSKCAYQKTLQDSISIFKKDYISVFRNFSKRWVFLERSTNRRLQRKHISEKQRKIQNPNAKTALKSNHSAISSVIVRFLPLTFGLTKCKQPPIKLSKLTWKRFENIRTFLRQVFHESFCWHLIVS